MKVLLIQPPIRDFYRTQFREYPLGLLYLAASLEKTGFEVGLLDARICKKPKKIPLPEEFKYLEKYYTKENNLFLNYKYFGLNLCEIESEIKKTKPDTIVLNAMFTPYVNEVLEIAKVAKNISSKIKVVVGGYHATVKPESFISENCVDLIVKGEGEQILPKIIDGDYSQKVFSDADGRSYLIENLDVLPHPARHLLNPDNYKFGKKHYAMILTSRGCPHKCSFCSVHAVCGHKHRVRNIDDVVDEIDECISKFNVRCIDFQDDNLLFDSGRIKNLFEKIIRKYAHYDIEWLATNGLNVAHLDSELLGLMKQIGFKKLDVALATADVSSRGRLKRPETVKQYEHILKIARGMGFDITTYVILGIPTQPLHEMVESIEYLKGKDTLIAPSVFYNVPGMPIFGEMCKYDYLPMDMARRSSAINNFGEDFSRDDIFKLFREIRRYNLTKKQFV